VISFKHDENVIMYAKTCIMYGKTCKKHEKNVKFVIKSLAITHGRMYYKVEVRRTHLTSNLTLIIERRSSIETLTSTR